MSGVAIYSELTPDVASAARAAAERIRAHIGVTKGLMVEIGRELIEAKRQLGHGPFLSWLQQEFEWSERTAQNLMSVAAALGDKSAKFADLPKSVLYALAAPSTPEPVREEVERRIDAGEHVDLEAVMALKRELLDAKESSKVAKQDAKVQKSEAQRAKDERDRTRNELDFAKAKVRQLAEEIERLKQDGVIHVYPSDFGNAHHPVEAIRPAPKPRGDCVRTAMELVSDRLDGDVDEIVALLREGGQFTVASELEAAAARHVQAA